ncbi:hypothetical protein ACIRBZ_46960 [Streptomyces sp. NPDC094038]|uniref:hypothetical protein n=1 Tax=Streptomyces sp. NPDC094038 TaxID=3366055 RepID=UPI00382A3769
MIDAILRADLDAPRKQCHTAKRVFDRLVDEHGMDNVSYGRVRDYIKRRRPEIWVEEGRGPPAVFIPQPHRPGEEAEVVAADPAAWTVDVPAVLADRSNEDGPCRRGRFAQPGHPWEVFAATGDGRHLGTADLAQAAAPARGRALAAVRERKAGR